MEEFNAANKRSPEGIEAIKNHFTWEDIEFIAKNNIGLRNAGSDARAEIEKTSGTKGDALPLCNIETASEEAIEKNKAVYERYKIKPPKPRNEATLAWYENTIKNFLEQAMGAHGDDNVNNFFLVRLGTVRGYDIEKYDDLGKAGVQEIPSEAYLAHFRIDSSENEVDVKHEVARAFALLIENIRLLERNGSSG